jgi:hypothetical protein
MRASENKHTLYIFNLIIVLNLLNLNAYEFCSTVFVAYNIVGNIILLNHYADPVAVRSETRALIARTLNPVFENPLTAWMFVLVFLCCVVLCR